MNDKTAQEFSASEKGSFAEFTIRERFPKIFREVCSEQYDEFIEHTTVADGIKDGDHAGLSALKKVVEPYNGKTLKNFFHDEPFFLVEFYFYDLIFLPLKKVRVIRIRAMSIPAILHSFLKNTKK